MKQLVLILLLILNNCIAKCSYEGVSNELNSIAIKLAITGYEKLKQSGEIANLRYITVADFSKPSNEERLFIIDMSIMKIVLKSLVAHGRNSGKKYAASFSNTIASYQSSLGFYITGDLYNGKHGKSLSLIGMEPGINDNAKQRAIVIHGANYVSDTFIQQQGYIGRSQGCPAVPLNKVEAIISTIQGASCLFIYAPDKHYLQASPLIH
jgi:hypothetical protein